MRDTVANVNAHTPHPSAGHLGSISTAHPCVANLITPHFGEKESGALMLKDLASNEPSRGDERDTL